MAISQLSPPTAVLGFARQIGPVALDGENAENPGLPFLGRGVGGMIFVGHRGRWLEAGVIVFIYT